MGERVNGMPIYSGQKDVGYIAGQSRAHVPNFDLKPSRKPYVREARVAVADQDGNMLVFGTECPARTSDVDSLG